MKLSVIHWSVEMWKRRKRKQLYMKSTYLIKDDCFKYLKRKKENKHKAR